MAALLMHAVVYAVVNAVLVFAWTLTAGSLDELGSYAETPADAVTLSFWPIVPIVVWGAALVIHAAAVLVSRLPGSRRRRRERERRRRRKEYTRRRTQRRALRDARRTSAAATRHAKELTAQVASLAASEVARTGQDDPAAVTASEDVGATAAGPRRRWVVVVFTDISRSTPLAEVLGDDAWAEVLAEHRGSVRGAVSDHGGSEVGTQGDGFLVRFDDPPSAVACAVELQRRLDARRQAGKFTPEVRFGIHAGEAIHDDDEDLVGRVVNLASRLVDAAEPGEILVTEPVADQLDPALHLVDRGLRHLKGLATPRHLLAVAWQESPDVIVLRSESDDRG